MRIYAFSAYHFHRTAKVPANNRFSICLRCCLPPQPTHKNNPANNRFSIGFRNCPKSQLPHKTPDKHPVPLPLQP